MNSSEIERIIDIILYDELEVDEFLPDSKSIKLVLRTPTPKEKAKAARIYAKELKHAKNLGMLSDDEAIIEFIKLGMWSQEDELQISGLKEDINKIKRGLIDLVFRRDVLEKSRKLLRSAEFKLMEKLTARHELLSGTAESHALVLQQRYIISQITMTEDGHRFWPTNDVFDLSSDFKLIDRLCLLFFKVSRINTSAIRQIARSNIWRSTWSSSQKIGSLFDKPVPFLSHNQQELIHWSCIYDSVFEAYERPTKDIIEDDDVLDSWFMKQGEKIEDRSRKQFGDEMSGKQGRKGGRNEQFIFADSEGAKKVYEMNHPNTRKMIQTKQSIVEKEGYVKDQHMPDSQNEMRTIAMDRLRKHALKK
jgi:hypothetical protein